jgi:16S rRNA (uracil1498-N3)-methyltransferase
MRITRIYHPEVLEVGNNVMLGVDAAHHIGTVLRFKVGDEFIVFDGKGTEYQVRIVAIQKKQVQVTVIATNTCARESPLKIHLAQGVAKGERWVYSLQKAVELGVTEITPLWTQHVAYKWEKKIDEKKMEQWSAILISACEQSGRTEIPKLNPLCQFEDFMKNESCDNKIILQPEIGIHWKSLNWQSQMKCTLLIGPEGGFSDLEYEQAKDYGYQGMTLGPRVLRTETAVVSGLTILQALHGDL